MAFVMEMNSDFSCRFSEADLEPGNVFIMSKCKGGEISSQMTALSKLGK